MALTPKQYHYWLPEKEKKNIRESKTYWRYNSGIYNTNTPEPVPNYNVTKAENVIQGKQSQFIIMGRDRPRGIDSGYGGWGNTHCATIDIVAGLSGRYARGINKPEEEKVFTDKSPELDAARIYISQKTDVDDNFNLTPGNVGQSRARSAVAVKADAVRIIGRDGIKLITGTDVYDSQGVRIDVQNGIDLIAGNNDECLSPLVRGDRLVEALQEIIDMIADLNGIVVSMMNQYFQLVSALALHTHISTVPGSPVTPSPDFAATAVSQYSQLIKLGLDLAIHQKNTVSTKMDYTYPTGGGYINSVFNTTN